MKIFTIFPQTAACNDSYPEGRCIEAHYRAENGAVALCDAEGAPVRDSWGRPVTQKLAAGENAAAVASRLALKQWRANDDGDGFNRPIRYERIVF